MDEFFSFFCGKWKKQTFLVVSVFFSWKMCAVCSSSCIFFFMCLTPLISRPWLNFFFFLSQVKVIAGNLEGVFYPKNVGNSGKCPLKSAIVKVCIFHPNQVMFLFPRPESSLMFFGKGDCWYPKLEKELRHRLLRSRQKGGFFFEKVPRTHDFPAKCPRPFFSVASPSTLIEMRISKKRKIDRFFRRRRQTALIFFLSSHGLLNVFFLVLALTTTYFPCRKKHH